jgi:pimeloyl-ACP methyl ester carboxylesterase
MFKSAVPFMWLYRLFAWIIMPKSNHAESRILFVTEAKKLAQKEFLRWFKLTQEINPLLKYFSEKELPIPLLYIMGEEDHLFLPPVKKLVEAHKASALKILKHCGHVCNVEAPAAFNDAAISFINTLSISPSNQPRIQSI